MPASCFSCEGSKNFKPASLYNTELRFDFTSDSLIYPKSVNNERLAFSNLPRFWEVSLLSLSIFHHLVNSVVKVLHMNIT